MTFERANGGENAENSPGMAFERTNGGENAENSPGMTFERTNGGENAENSPDCPIMKVVEQRMLELAGRRPVHRRAKALSKEQNDWICSSGCARILSKEQKGWICSSAGAHARSFATKSAENVAKWSLPADFSAGVSGGLRVFPGVSGCFRAPAPATARASSLAPALAQGLVSAPASA